MTTKQMTFAYIPLVILFNEHMTNLERQLWWLIKSLDNEMGCTASNRYMSICMNVKKKTIYRAIKYHYNRNN